MDPQGSQARILKQLLFLLNKNRQGNRNGQLNRGNRPSSDFKIQSTCINRLLAHKPHLEAMRFCSVLFFSPSLLLAQVLFKQVHELANQAYVLNEIFKAKMKYACDPQSRPFCVFSAFEYFSKKKKEKNITFH